jgi:nucleoside-diphosphate-sugar epimerase
MVRPMKSALILGCGFTGKALARLLLERGFAVRGTARTAEGVERLRGLGIEPWRLDSADSGTLAGVASGMDVAFDLIPPELYADATAELLRACEAGGVGKFVYVSSTAVYGETAGEWIDEDTPPRPLSARARARLAAEESVRAAHRERGIDTVIVRAAGIYGPGRTLAHRIRRGAFRPTGDGEGFVNRIHVSDLARVLFAAAERGRAGAVYLASDDAPERERVVAGFCARLVGLPLPAAANEMTPGDDPGSARGNKRVRNDRIKSELGVRLRYPSYREGIPAALAETGEIADSRL